MDNIAKVGRKKTKAKTLPVSMFLKYFNMMGWVFT